MGQSEKERKRKDVFNGTAFQSADGTVTKQGFWTLSEMEAEVAACVCGQAMGDMNDVVLRGSRPFSSS
jgi:hypothetical protein